LGGILRRAAAAVKMAFLLGLAEGRLDRAAPGGGKPWGRQGIG
jgi:hypothetical protein